MLLGSSRRQPYWRALFVLGRVGSLPTVWSACLAGWLLGGGGHPAGLVTVVVGVSCLYVGGMCLNDAFDVIYDREHRPERPIPGGLVSVDAAWRWGFGALSLGWVTLILAGPRTGVIGFVLLGTIILYDAVHKSLSVAPLVVGLCRCLVYLVAASAASDGVTGLTVWSGLAVVLYVTGQRCLARRERSKGPVEAWPVWLLTAPLLLALVANGGSYLVRSLVISCLASAWVLRSLYFTFGAPVRNVGLTVSGLTSGLVWMDALAVAGGDPLRWSLVFVGLFLAAFVAQRLIPSP